MPKHECIVQLDECRISFILNRLEDFCCRGRFVLNSKSEIREQIENKIKTCEDDIKKHEV
jgi:hypothetical protein